MKPHLNTSTKESSYTNTDFYYPLRLGRLGQDSSGNTVLINPQGKAFAINQTIKKTWEACDGKKNQHDIIKFLIQDSKQKTSTGSLRKHYHEILERLKSTNLAA